MPPRLKTRWNRAPATRDYRAVAGAIGVNLWRITTECLLNLENEGFETRDDAQRLDAISEFAAFALHLLDRYAYGRLTDADRAALVEAAARRFGEIIRDNRADAGDDGDHLRRFIGLVNRRAEEYAECGYDAAAGPSFTMRRLLGERVRDAMDEKHRRWIPDYVIDAEAPALYKELRRAASMIGAASDGVAD